MNFKTESWYEMMMAACNSDLELMDRPEILEGIFFPRKASSEEAFSPYGTNYFIGVADGVSIGCRFYPARTDGPSILYFHGTGEIASDFDYTAHFYQERGINLFVADYRGYGMSTGTPSCSAVISDADPVFQGFTKLLSDQGHTGRLFVMGRSLGSAAAIEIACRYQQRLGGLILESGFASTLNQLIRLGAHKLLKEVPNLMGFGNDIKIKDITIPTLIIHGEEDERISVEEGRALYFLSGAARKFSLFIPDAGHNDLMLHDLKGYMDAIEQLTNDAFSDG